MLFRGAGKEFKEEIGIIEKGEERRGTWALLFGLAILGQVAFFGDCLLSVKLLLCFLLLLLHSNDFY